jgi:26S proteasome regulatory subunit (ATPase 3-interacting protein)
VAPETRALVKGALERYRKAWQQRKRMVMDMVDNMAEGLEKKPRDVCGLLGLETDEELKLDIKQFMA